ncbi:hypothetical protein D3C81_1817900 [compost metagenome]
MHAANGGGVGEGALEGLVDPRFSSGFDERPEALHRYRLVRNARRGEFHDRAVFIPDPETANRLSPVDVKCPHRNPLQAGKSGEEARERLRPVKLFNDERIFLKSIFRHRAYPSVK